MISINWFRSRIVVQAAVICIFMIVLAWLTAFPRSHPMTPGDINHFVNQTVTTWQSEYGGAKAIKVARIDIKFSARPDNFSKGEGAVIAPVGLNLPAGQEILATATYPPSIRELPVDDIKAMSWPYPGKCRSNLHYVALCLVRQKMHPEPINMVENPSYSQLPAAFVSDALATAKELEEHSLDECAAFPDWPGSIAGDLPRLQQFKKIMETVASGIIDENEAEKNSDDICAAMRKNRFTLHRAHVLAVMACRQIGIPSFAFTAATEKKCFIVGTFSDTNGWIYFDLAQPQKGMFSDPPVLLTRAPLFADFKGARHGYWSAHADAYSKTLWGFGRLSYTKWGGEEAGGDITLARTYQLDDWKR